MKTRNLREQLTKVRIQIVQKYIYNDVYKGLAPYHYCSSIKSNSHRLPKYMRLAIHVGITQIPVRDAISPFYSSYTM